MPATPGSHKLRLNYINMIKKQTYLRGISKGYKYFLKLLGISDMDTLILLQRADFFFYTYVFNSNFSPSFTF